MEKIIIDIRDFNRRWVKNDSTKVIIKSSTEKDVQTNEVEDFMSRYVLNEERQYYYIVDGLPTCEQKYWKAEGGVIIEMNDTEKTEVDRILNYEQRKIEFKNKKIRVTCLTDVNAEIIAGYSYFAAIYPDFWNLCIGRSDDSILTDIDDNKNGIAYFNIFDPEEAEDLLKQDSRIKIEYLDE